MTTIVEIYTDGACRGNPGPGGWGVVLIAGDRRRTLYGGDPETLTETITYSRFGVMPAWAEEWRPGQGLTEAEINAVAAYVHQLGGGE